MSLSKKRRYILGVMVVFAMALGACATPEPEVIEVEKIVEVEVGDGGAVGAPLESGPRTREATHQADRALQIPHHWRAYERSHRGSVFADEGVEH